MVKLQSIGQVLGSTKVRALPSLHAPSGADITGSFDGKGNALGGRSFGQHEAADEKAMTALENLGTRCQPTADNCDGNKKPVHAQHYHAQ